MSWEIEHDQDTSSGERKGSLPDKLLALLADSSAHPDDLYTRYGDEMQWVFREELKRAARRGLKEYTAVWCSVLRDTALQIGPS